MCFVQVNQSHTFRHGQVGQMHGVTDIQSSHIDFDGFRDITWTTGNQNFVVVVADDTAALGTDTDIFIDEVQRYADLQFRTGYNANEIHVQDLLLVGVTLNVLEQGSNWFTTINADG